MALVNLAEFGLPGKIFFTDIVKRDCKRWLIDDYINGNKIDLIIFIIINLGNNIANHLEKSIVICPCQMSRVNQPNKNDIEEISDKTVYKWVRMISKNGKLLEIRVDVANKKYRIDNNNLVETIKPIHKKIAIGKKLLIPIE